MFQRAQLRSTERRYRSKVVFLQTTPVLDVCGLEIQGCKLRSKCDHYERKIALLSTQINEMRSKVRLDLADLRCEIRSQTSRTHTAMVELKSSGKDPPKVDLAQKFMVKLKQMITSIQKVKEVGDQESVSWVQSLIKL